MIHNKVLQSLFKIEDRKTDRIVDLVTVALVESIGDIVVAVVITALALAYMSVAIGPAMNLIAGYYIAFNVLLTIQRVLHRVDDSWTINELADRMITETEEIKQQLDRIEHNA